MSFSFLFLRIPWSLSTILKTSSKSAWSNVFRYIKVYIFWQFIQYTIHWNKTQTLQKFILEKSKGHKKCTLFLYRALAHHSFTFNSQFLYDLKHKVRLCMGFHSVSFLLKFIFLFNKKHVLSDSRTPTFKKIFAKMKFSPALFEKIPSFFCLVFKIQK